MTTLLQEPSVNSNRKKSKKTSVTPLNSELCLLKRGKTAFVKQAKRDKESKEIWKSKATQRCLENNANRKKIAEILESRESHIFKKKDFQIINEKFFSDIEQLELKLIKEIARGDNEQKLRFLAEGEVINANKIIEQIKKENCQMELFAESQIILQNEIKKLNLEVENYKFEVMKDKKSEITIEMSENIKNNIHMLYEKIQISETVLKINSEKKKYNLKISSENNLSNLCHLPLCYADEKVVELKKVQESLKIFLDSVNDRFNNKKNRIGIFSDNERPKNYSYTVKLIKATLLWVFEGAISLRAASKAAQITSIFFDFPTPSYTIISEWAKKIGFYIYNSSKDKNINRVWIVDFSIQFGQDKLMLILGVDIAKINEWKKQVENNNDKKIKFEVNYKDVEVLHMVVVKSTAYEIVLNELKKTGDECGLPLFILSDEGSDLAKGIRIFIENNPGIQHLNDISHKLSNILKALLNKDAVWNNFCQALTLMKQKLKLSDIAEICPPKFRQKVRFLNIREPIKWAVKMLDLDLKIFTPSQRGNFKKYIMIPLEEFREEIINWNEHIEIVTLVETEIKHKGLTRGNGGKIRSTSDILANQTKGFKKSVVQEQIFKFIKEQEAKLLPGQTLLGSTDVEESIFGKWKSIVHEDSMAGITDMILVLPLLTVSLTDELILNALEATSVKQINEWKEEALGRTMYAKRRQILHPKKNGKKGRKSGEVSLRKLKKVA